jgi:hypothetical protein
MWGAALFFITMVMVTECGRDAASVYVQRIVSLFSGQLPYSDVALWVMALSALGCLLLMRKRAPERSVERWVVQIRVGHDAEASPRQSAGESLALPTR